MTQHNSICSQISKIRIQQMYVIIDEYKDI